MDLLNVTAAQLEVALLQIVCALDGGLELALLLFFFGCGGRDLLFKPFEFAFVKADAELGIPTGSERFDLAFGREVGGEFFVALGLLFDG